MVKQPADDSEEFWLSVTEHKLVEKDIEGHIIEMLDLSALLHVQVLSQVRNIQVFLLLHDHENQL